MPTIDKLLTGRAPVALEESATVIEAVEAMNAERIGCVLVLNRGRAAGIFTERDLMIRVVAARRDPETTKLSEVMTREMITVLPTKPTADVREQMQAEHIRHVPVIGEDGKVHGVLSLRDLLRADLEARKSEIRQLTDYIQGDPSA